jgi:rhamnosyltransferase
MMPFHRRVALVIPTLNAASEWSRLASAIQSQLWFPDEILIVDSESTDSTPELARQSGFRVANIPRAQFNHGGTRQWALQFVPDAEILVFLTQDAILADKRSLVDLLKSFDDPCVGAAFGRQLPRPGSNAIEAHARLFNYPDRSDLRTLESRSQIGIKAIFLSNSFAAFRRCALESVGGFPTDVILAEDMIAAARMLMKEWKIAYVAEARVYHSHAYTWWQEFKRYFDTGVLHARESWLLDNFGKAGGEGRRFVISELKYLSANDRVLIPSALVRTLLKWAGYRLGRSEAHIGNGLKRHLSMHRRFWDH